MPTVADALMAAVLADPADPLPRLVFADYLDDAGGPANAAWAEYIRLRAAAAVEGSALKRELFRQSAADMTLGITAGLTLSAARFLAETPSFLDLLPADRFTVRLDGFTPPRLVPDPDVCRMNRGLPLGLGAGQTVVGVIAEATELDRTYWADRYRPALFVRIPTDELEPALQRAFAPRSLALFQPPVTVTPVVPTLDDQLAEATAEVMRTFLEQLVGQARERKASAIDITAYTTHHWVRRVEHGKSLRWHRVGTTLGRNLVRAARALSARRLHVRVRQRDSSFGEGVRIVLLNPPAGPGVPGPG